MTEFDIKKHIVVISGYLFITMVMTYPAIFNLSSLIGPAEDNQMFIWNIWWFKFSIFDLGVSPFYTDYLFYPDGAGLLFHTYSPLNNLFGLVLAPVFGHIISYNFLILITFIVAAYGCFLLARELGLNPKASFISGLIFSFNPFHLAHALHHLNISSIQFIPLVLYFAIRACRNRKSRFILAGSLFLAANFYLDYYIFLFSLTLLIPLLFLRPAPESGLSRFQQIKPMIYIIAAGIMLTLPLSIPMIKQSLLNGFEDTIGYDIFVADLAGFIFPHKYHWTGFFEFNRTVNSTFTGNFWESTAFLGYAAMAMAAWAIWKRKFALKSYFIVIGLIGIILALGTYPHILGQKVSFLPLPYNIIQYIPGLNAARSPGRFVILTYLAMAIIVGNAVDAWMKKPPTKNGKKGASIAFVIIIAAVIMDYWSAPLQMTKIETPEFYRVLKNQPGDFAVLDLPPASRDVNLRTMYYQTIHEKPICGGQLARSQKSIENYIRRWRGFEMTAAALEKRKVKYIVLHGDFVPPKAYSDYFNRLNDNFDFIGEGNNTAFFLVY